MVPDTITKRTGILFVWVPVSALKPCTVAVANSTYDSRWMPCQNRRGMCLIASEESWTTTGSQHGTTPHTIGGVGVSQGSQWHEQLTPAVVLPVVAHEGRHVQARGGDRQHAEVAMQVEQPRRPIGGLEASA